MLCPHSRYTRPSAVATKAGGLWWGHCRPLGKRSLAAMINGIITRSHQRLTFYTATTHAQIAVRACVRPFVCVRVCLLCLACVRACLAKYPENQSPGFALCCAAAATDPQQSANVHIRGTHAHTLDYAARRVMCRKHAVPRTIHTNPPAFRAHVLVAD